jgi:hypothetical protein
MHTSQTSLPWRRICCWVLIGLFSGLQGLAMTRADAERRHWHLSCGMQLYTVLVSSALGPVMLAGNVITGNIKTSPVLPRC